RLHGEQALAEQGGEQQEQVEDREGEEPLGVGPLGARQQPPGERQEGCAADRRDRQVDRAAEAGGGRRQRQRDQDQAVDEDLPAGGGLPRGDRQHRHAGALVVLAGGQRQRPEVRRRPEEDDGDQQPGVQR